MARKSSKQPIAKRYRERIYLGGPGKPPVISVHWTRNAKGEVLNYGLAYIDFSLHPSDNGRVLGYDNGHGVYERHLMGVSGLVDFVSFEETTDRFFAEVDKLRRGESL